MLSCDNYYLGGLGQFNQVRIVEGSAGSLTAGRQYTIEADFTTHHAASGLEVNVVVKDSNGKVATIFDEELPNSAVVPEIPYTVRFYYTPAAHLAGTNVAIKIQVEHVHTAEEWEDHEEHDEDCAIVNVKIVWKF